MNSNYKIISPPNSPSSKSRQVIVWNIVVGPMSRNKRRMFGLPYIDIKCQLNLVINVIIYPCDKSGKFSFNEDTNWTLFVRKSSLHGEISKEAVLILFGCVYKLTELFFFHCTALLFININFYVFLCKSVHINNLRESV